jgi:hypothetical protein
MHDERRFRLRSGDRAGADNVKRLLLVTYVFPSEPSPGALRAGYLARYLPQFGWDVTVLTRNEYPRPFPAKVVACGPSSSVEDRIPYRLRAWLLFPDSTSLWIPAALRAGRALLRSNRFDAILGSALPASVHVIAGLLARNARIPWVADYRDPWSGNAYVKRRFPRNVLETRFERSLLRKANVITTISEPIARGLCALHGRDSVEIIPNAYDPSDWDDIAGVPSARFSLCFTGTMHNWLRNPYFLFADLSQLRNEHHEAGNAEVHFYGPGMDGVERAAARYGITPLVHCHGTVPRMTAMAAQRSASALLIFLNMDPRTAGEMGSKYLEYLGAGRPIIAFGPSESVMRSFIDSQRIGWFASNETEAREAIIQAYDTFHKGSPALMLDRSGIPDATDLARRFARVLDTVA